MMVDQIPLHKKKTRRIRIRQRSKSIGDEPTDNGLETPNNSPVSLSSNSTTSKGGRKRKSKRILKKRSKFTRKRKSYKKINMNILIKSFFNNP
jgi:hypothetical protein